MSSNDDLIFVVSKFVVQDTTSLTAVGGVYEDAIDVSTSIYFTSDGVPVAEPTTWDFSATVDSIGEVNGAETLNSIILSRGNNPVVATIDFVRVGTDFDSVTAVPEPSTYAAIVGVLALGLAIWRRRK